MDDEHIDFAALDPSLDPSRWNRLIDDIVARAVDERRARLSVQAQLLRWSRPVLAMAAAACLLAWAGGWLRGSSWVVQADAPTVLTVANWAANHEVPAPGDLLAILQSM